MTDNGKEVQFALFWVDSAALCVEIGMLDEGLNQLKYALQADNTCLDAYMSIAQLLSQLNRCHEAIKCL